MGTATVARKTGPKPSKEGPREGLIAIKCRLAYKAWFTRFADQERINPASLFDLALLEYAKLRKFELPPKR